MRFQFTFTKILLIFIMTLSSLPLYAEPYIALKRQADAFAKKGDYRSALDLYKESYHFAPSRHELIISLSAIAVSEKKLGNNRKSAGYIKRIINIAPKAPFAKSFPKKNRLRITERVSYISEGDVFSHHLKKGNTQNENGLFDAAVVSYTKALSLATSKKDQATSLASLIPSSKCSTDRSEVGYYIKRLKKHKKLKDWAHKQITKKAVCVNNQPNTVFTKNDRDLKDKQCSDRPSYSCGPHEQRTVARQICKEYFTACDSSKSSASRAQNYEEHMNCKEATRKFFGETFNKRLANSADRIMSNNTVPSDSGSIIYEIFRQFVDESKNATRDEIFNICNNAALQVCSHKYDQWKLNCTTK